MSKVDGVGEEMVMFLYFMLKRCNFVLFSSGPGHHHHDSCCIIHSLEIGQITCLVRAGHGLKCPLSKSGTRIARMLSWDKTGRGAVGH